MLQNIEVKELVSKKKFKDSDEFESYRYDSGSQFFQPFVVRGTAKQIVPYEGVIRIKNPDAKVTGDFLLNITSTENDLKDLPLEAVDKIELISVQDRGFALKVEKDGLPLFLFIEKHSNFAFTNLCKILKVPFSYAKRNPEDLNQTNFDYWKKLLGQEKTPIHIVYSELDWEGFQFEGNLVRGFLVKTIFPAAFEKLEGAPGGKQNLNLPLNMEIGFLSQILPKIEGVLKLSCATLELHLDQIYSGFESGNHVVRLLIQDPSLALTLGAVEYLPFVTIASNFDGWRNEKSRVQIRIGWCNTFTSSAYMLPMSDAYARQIRDRWVQDKLHILKLAPSDKTFNKVLKALEKKANRMFGGYQLNFTVGEVMNGLSSSELGPMFSEFINQKAMFEDLFRNMNLSFNTLSVEEFVEVTDSLSRKFGLPECLTKYLILEYISEGTNQFECPLDLVEFVGFAAQSLNLRVQQKVQDVILKLGQAWLYSFVERQSHRQVIVDKYLSYIKY